MLFERELDREDMLRFLIMISARGRDLVHTYARQHFHTMDDCLNTLTAEEKEHVSQILERLNENPTLQKRAFTE